MLGLINKVLNRKQESSGGTSPVSGTGEPDKVRNIIAAAVLLLEAAYADYECSDDEMAHIIETLKDRFDLSQEYTEELIELARKEREQAIDLWQYSNLINQQYSLAEKMEFMEAAWRIIYVDGVLEKYEEHFARRLANLLRLSHSEMIATKIKARDQVAVDKR